MLSSSSGTANSTSRASTAPTASPPANSLRKCQAAWSGGGGVFVAIAPSSSVNSAIAAASFSSASPSTSRVSRPVAPISRKMPTTALGSVVATMAPSMRQTVRLWPESGSRAAPTTTVLTSTATIAMASTGTVSRANCLTSRVSAPWNTRMGKKTSRKVSALTGKFNSTRARSSNRLVSGVASSQAAPAPIIMPTSASSTASEIASRRASGWMALMTISSAAMASRTLGSEIRATVFQRARTASSPGPGYRMGYRGWLEL